jgi:lysophospholipase L1-like esterase
MTTATNPKMKSRLEDELSDVSWVRFLGRTIFDPNTRSRVFYHTGSGFEVAFEGTRCLATFLSTPHDIESRQAYLVVWVDQVEKQTVRLEQAKQEIILAESLPDGMHVVKVAKRSEAADTWTALQAILTDGNFLMPPKAKKRALTIVGASNSCGYGNIGAIGIPKSTANSNGMLGFGYRAAKILDWDVTIVGASGWGLTRGYNTGGVAKPDATLPYSYRYPGILPDGTVETRFGLWQFPHQHPDVILFNLGSNDFNASNYDQMNLDEKQTFVAAFEDAYGSFLAYVQEQHPATLLIVTYGLTGETKRLGPIYDSIVTTARAKGIQAIALELEAAGSNGNPFGSDYHPNQTTHENNAWIVASCIQREIASPKTMEDSKIFQK